MEININKKIDNRQFIIMGEPYKSEDFSSVSLSEKIVLSYHSGLKIHKLNECLLLGDAFSVLPQLPLCDIGIESMPYIAGRWVLIHKNKLYLDACGSLGVYYTQHHGQLLLSSSLHLLSEMTGKKWHADYKAESGKGGILDYYPIPYTPYEGIKKLLPSQTISFDGEVSFRSNYMIPRYKNKNIHALITDFIDAMSCEMQNISKEYGNNVWFSLTGGYDSRVNVAIAKYSGIQFHVYTALRDSLKMFDLLRAKQVCRKIGVKHETIDDRSIVADSKQREEAFDIHTGGHITFGTEKKQFIAASDVINAEESIVLWGTMWAMSYKAYENFMAPCKGKTEIYREISKWASEPMNCSWVHKKSIGEWIDYTLYNPISNMDWRQRLYWEERNGAWVSAAHQGIDLFDSIRIAPVNCQYLIEILLSFPDNLQHDKIKQKMIIDQCCPKLRKVPYGESIAIITLHRIRNKASQIFKR